MKLQHQADFIRGRIPLLAGLLGLCFISSPLHAAVESNVVGYTTITTKAGFNMQGVCFNALDGEAISFNDLLSGEFQDGDEILVLTTVTSGSTYERYRYSSERGEWITGRTSADTKPVKAGSSFWLNTTNAVEVTFKGSVKPGNYLYTSQAGVQMITSDFPIAFPLNATDGSVVWENLTDGDEILWLNENGAYDRCRYSTERGKWIQGRGESSKVIPAGTSVWLETANSGATLLIVNPVK